MNILQRFEQWGDSHHPKWLDIIRIILGVFLCYKGIDFLQNMGSLMSIMSNKVQFNSLMFIVLGHYVVFAHIIGGILLTIGLFTRFACLIQIPIMIVAVLFINTGGNMMRPYSEFFLSLVVLLLLVYFLIVGNGPWSFKLADEERKNIG
ncbi:MAG: DoxX family protein [Ferruginibacter sp.]